jgi:alpha-tubulin suppressor-like RCC1 family protein
MSTDNKLYGWGNNEHNTVSSIPLDLLPTPTLCTTFHLNHASIVQVASGYSHVLVITLTSQIYAWGNNEYGQLGFPATPSNKSHNPQEVILGEGAKAKAVLAGDFFSVALTEEGEVYTWGQNQSGQLGRAMDSSHKPTKVNLPKRIKKIALAEHVMALTEDGGLFAWGLNNDGQLGLDHQTNAHSPVELLIKDEEVIDIACGLRHTLALTRAGNFYSWGDNYRGQLALGHTEDQHIPTPAQHSHFVALACGWKHCLALGKDGTLHGWGNNGQYQLGLGKKISKDLTGVPYPILIPPPSSSRIVSIFCVWDSSFLVTANGYLYAAGSNCSGMLGFPSLKENVCYFTHVPGNLWNLPRTNTEMRWREVLSWLFLGKLDNNSKFYNLPIEVLNHITHVLHQAE